MAAEREPPPLGDVKPTDFEELEDGEDLFTSTVSTLEVRRAGPPRRGGPGAARFSAPRASLGRLFPGRAPRPLPTPGSCPRPGPVTPVTLAAPQVPCQGGWGGRGGQAGLGAAACGPGGPTSSSGGRDPRMEPGHALRAPGPSASLAPLPPGRRKACSPPPPSASRAPPLPLGFQQPPTHPPRERGLFPCPPEGVPCKEREP